MDIKKVKGILAAGALTGIVMATMLGLGLRNVARAAVAQNAPVAVQSAPADSRSTFTQNNSASSFVGERGEQNEGWEFNDD
jgi:hypothetical protein